MPTRELATQVADEVRALSAGKPFRVLSATSGLPKSQEAVNYGPFTGLENLITSQDPYSPSPASFSLFFIIISDIVIATPMRLTSFVERDVLRTVHHLVLDECDKLLEEEFREQVHPSSGVRLVKK